MCPHGTNMRLRLTENLEPRSWCSGWTRRVWSGAEQLPKETYKTQTNKRSKGDRDKCSRSTHKKKLDRNPKRRNKNKGKGWKRPDHYPSGGGGGGVG
ncbi:hypothetical protein LINPERHAP1_LOCUS4704, partial [Linum perenne]